MVGPPTDVVTFLFTDIEGSTRMWERETEAMRSALARHDEILRQTLRSRGGDVFKTMGDAFCVAFDSAPAALAAALAAQRALLREPWETLEPVRVRMALHAGGADRRGGDFFGPTVNRVARLLAAGHGGQILLSGAARELVGDRLPEGATLRDLGERRLKDLLGSERIFVLGAPGLPSGLPALRTLDDRPNNLPAQPTPLVGREPVVAEIRDLMRRGAGRLLTLTGPGGTGKTRLALQVAAELLDEFESGVLWVPLGAVLDSDFVAPAIAGGLGVAETEDRPLEEALEGHLRGRQMLLVLDNFEQVAAAAPLVASLLSASPALKVLATSRGALGVYGEREYPVPPLEMPDPARASSAEDVAHYEAVRLFVERARASDPAFLLSGENAAAVAEVCVRLDGLPLAIELAAARAKLIPPRTMLKRLDSRLEVLTGGARDLPERQRTLRGAIAWSYDLLEDRERVLFARLAVFSGGCDLAAAEGVCAADPTPAGEPLHALDDVSSLLEKGLLRREVSGEEPRLVMLETIHEFARERLRVSGEDGGMRRRHAAYFLALAERAYPELTGSHRQLWFERLETDHDNLRAAIHWALEGDLEAASRLAAALTPFWEERSYLSEGSRWLEAALRGGANPRVRADALTEAGMFAWRGGDDERAERMNREALALYRETGDELGIGFVLNSVGVRELEGGNPDRATELFEEALRLSREAGDDRTAAYALRNLAEVARHRAEYARALDLGLRSVAIFREADDPWHVARGLAWVGRVALLAGEGGRAEGFLREGLLLAGGMGDAECAASCLEVCAALAGARGLGARSARLYGAAERLRETVDARLPPGDRPDNDHRVAAARAKLDEAAWQGMWSEGRTMSLAEAVEYARDAGT